MDKDQRLLEEAYTKVLKEESNLEKALKDTQKEHEAFQNRKAEASKDLSQPVSGQLGHDEKGNFVYKPSGYEHGKFYKSLIGSLFDEDLKEVPRGTPVKEGMLWTEQDVNTIKVFRATNVDGRLMKVEVPRKEVVEKGLDFLISERTLQEIADRQYKGNLDLARGWRIIYAPEDFNMKCYSAEEIFRSLEAMHKEGVRKSECEELTRYYKKMFKIKEMDDALSKDFDIKALEDF